MYENTVIMYYYYLDVDTGYEYNSWIGNPIPADTLNDAIRKGKNLLARNLNKYEEAVVKVSKGKKTDALLKKSIVGTINYHAKEYYPAVKGKVYTYQSKGSYKAYEILADGSRGRLIWDGKTRAMYI